MLRDHLQHNTGTPYKLLKKKFYLLSAELGLHCRTGLSLVRESRGALQLRCRFSLQRLLLLQSTGSSARGFSRCGSRALEHRLSTCGAYRLSCPTQLESSRTRAGTCASCTGRCILYCWDTREAQHLVQKGPFNNQILDSWMPIHGSWFSSLEKHHWTNKLYFTYRGCKIP